MAARLFVLLEYLLPRFWLTALVHRIARLRSRKIKDFLITQFVRLYDVDTEEVQREVPAGFATLNEFFIRELKEGARPVDDAPGTVVSPVDGTVSSAGRISGHHVFQAKGLDYSLEDLLATDLQEVRHYVDGSYATLYLAPYNYHRVHSPIDGKIVAARYVPGDLFSVNAATVTHLSGLFRRNERLVLHIETAHGPAVLVLVGALNVGSISTPWSGEVRPKKRGVVETIELGAGPDVLHRGDLVGWFNMGSTVIVLLPADRCKWHDDLVAGATVSMGQAIGHQPAP